MVQYTCDGCGVALPEKGLRYTVSIESKAVYESEVIHLLDLVQDHRKEMERLIARLNQADADALEGEIYQAKKLDLCSVCHKRFMHGPTQFGAADETPPPTAGMDVEDFLRSLYKERGE